MERCPFCGSEDIYYSKKRKIFVCEDCDETFSEHQLSTFKDEHQSRVGLVCFSVMAMIKIKCSLRESNRILKKEDIVLD